MLLPSPSFLALSWHWLGRLPDALLAVVAAGAAARSAEAVPSRPVLDKNASILTSSGFKVQIASDPATKKLMATLPSHQFVVRRRGSARYLYADPNVCVCVYVGDGEAYRTIAA